ncbi:MAG: hypothetical protein ACTS7E_02220 [Arsenophonus sp. NC-CH8-MAG3]
MSLIKPNILFVKFLVKHPAAMKKNWRNIEKMVKYSMTSPSQHTGRHKNNESK